MNTEAMHSNASRSPEVACLVCEAVFVPRKPWQRFCSVKCRNGHHKGKNLVATLIKRVEALEKEVELIRGHLVL